MYRYRFEYIKDKAKHAALIAEHNRILQALMTRDKAAAALAATEHIDNQQNAIIRTIRSEQAGK